MKIATIVPIAYAFLTEENDYHMCLAHLMKNPAYGEFFKRMADEGRFVLMDNGVVETHVPMNIDVLVKLAAEFNVSEFILPDVLYDKESTLKNAHKALAYVQVEKIRGRLGRDVRVMAVPQGRNKDEWVECVNALLELPVDSIGISRFVSKFFVDRESALKYAPKLLDSDKDIHLLGCPGDPLEIYNIEKRFPGRIRGVDSGIASMYTQKGMRMADLQDKPNVEMDFIGGELESPLMLENYLWWEDRIINGKGASA